MSHGILGPRILCIEGFANSFVTFKMDRFASRRTVESSISCVPTATDRDGRGRNLRSHARSVACSPERRPPHRQCAKVRRRVRNGAYIFDEIRPRKENPEPPPHPCAMRCAQVRKWCKPECRKNPRIHLPPAKYCGPTKYPPFRRRQALSRLLARICSCRLAGSPKGSGNC